MFNLEAIKNKKVNIQKKRNDSITVFASNKIWGSFIPCHWSTVASLQQTRILANMLKFTALVIFGNLCCIR